MGLSKEEITEETKKQLWLSWPMIFVSVFQFSLQLISLMFVGHLSELPLAAVSLSTSIVNATGFMLMVSSHCTLNKKPLETVLLLRSCWVWCLSTLLTTNFCFHVIPVLINFYVTVLLFNLKVCIVFVYLAILLLVISWVCVCDLVGFKWYWSIRKNFRSIWNSIFFSVARYDLPTWLCWISTCSFSTFAFFVSNGKWRCSGFVVKDVYLWSKSQNFSAAGIRAQVCTIIILLSKIVSFLSRSPILISPLPF